MARNVFQLVHTESPVLATIPASCTPTTEPRILKGSIQLKSVAYGLINVKLLQLLHIVVINFSTIATLLSNRMVVVFATGPPTALIAASATLHHKHSIKVPDGLVHSALGHGESTSCEAKPNTARSRVLQVLHNNVYDLIEAVHYKSRTD